MLFSFTSIYSQSWLENLPQDKSKEELTFFDYKNAFETYWAPFNVDKGYYIENGIKIKAKGWKQFKRWEYDTEYKIDPRTGILPTKTAFQIYEEFLQVNPGIKSPAAANWTSMGPNSSTSGYAGIGRINCIAFHPSNNNMYWVGAASGGLWVTTNNGSIWTCLTDGNNALAVSDIVIPSDFASSNTIYIATGDKDAWDNRSVGVLKSTDGGINWSPTGISYTLSDGKMVNRLLLDPSNNQTILAATTNGVYKTTNGGTNWSTQMTTYNFIDMEYKPGNFATLYGSTTNGKIYVSTNSGATWTQAFSNTSAYRIELAVSANQSTWVYAVAANSSHGLYGVYKSTNSGGSYTQVFSGSTRNLLGWNSNGLDAGGQGWYDLSLAASPSNASTLLVGGVNTWRSTNGGTSWSIVNHWWGDGVPAVHADKHNLIYRNNGDLFECNDGGVYSSINNGTSWTDRTNGMVISQMYKLGNSATVANEVITGLQDNGTKLFGSSTWTDVKGGDGMECLIDYTNVNVQYGTYVYGQISRTTNHWSTSTSIEPASAGDGAWVTPYIISPTSSQTLYAGYADVWKTTNRGDSWTKISTMNTSNKIRSMAIAPSNTQVLYVADETHIWKTTNEGSSWSNITGSLPISSGYLTYITVKNNDANTLWVTLSGYTANTVYQSVNGGTTWTNISAGLPQIPAYTIVQNKQVTSAIHLYVGTELGVYFKNGTNNWIPYNTGLPNVKIGEMEIYYATNAADSKLRAATYGRGLWQTGLTVESSGTPSISIFPSELTETHVTSSQQTTQIVTVSNTGTTPLTFDLVVNTSRNMFVEDSPADYARLYEPKQADGLSDNSFMAGNAQPGGSSPNLTKDATLRYDNGVNNDAIGLTAGGTFQVAAYFPAATMGQYAGMKLSQMEIYINDVPVPCVLKVYGQGTATSPGALLHEQTVTPAGMSWNTFTLTDEVDITGQGLWIGYQVTHAAGQYPAGSDAGPHVTNGNWISSDGVAWDQLHIIAPSLDYNWNIAGFLVNGATPSTWLSAAPLSGTIAPGESDEIVVTFNSTDLTNGIYTGSLVFSSNDAANPIVTVPVTLTVGSSVFPPPQNLTSEVNGSNVNLAWEAPETGGGGGTTDDFEEDFESGNLPTGWMSYDVDGDSYKWENTALEFDVFEAHTGQYCMASASYRNDVGALTPNNWLVSPPIAVTASSQLKFWVSAQDPSWSAEQYYVKVSTTGNAVANFSQTIHSAVSPANWAEVVKNLSTYAGQTIYIAFQHANVTDQFFIKIDDFKVTNTDTKSAFTESFALVNTNGIPFKTKGMSQHDIDRKMRPTFNYTFGASAETTTIGGEIMVVPQGTKNLADKSAKSLLYDNGPFINSPGTGPGSTDQSILQNITLGMNTLGVGAQFAAGNHMADDFVVEETWTVESFTFYGYQTGSSTTSTMTGGYLQIWDGDPTTGGQIIWGNMTANRMSSTAWTNSYRLSEGTPGTTRPIMSITCATPDLVLEPGTYWVEYTLNGSLASGPWAPPITINGQAVTGNAKQYLGSSSEWTYFLDTGTGTPAQGLPFLILGNAGSGGNYNLTGYNIYKDGVLIDNISPSITVFTEIDVPAGNYLYGVSAVYDQPSQGESDAITTEVSVTQASLTVTPSNQNVAAIAGTTTFNVASNTSWVVSESVSWLSVSPTSGSNNGALTVNYTTNTSSSPRTGQITVTASGGSPVVNVTVSQAGVNTNLAVTPSNQNVSETDGTTTFNVASNTSWVVSETVAWLSVNPTSGSNNGTLTVSYNANTSSSPRTGQITVTAGGGTPFVIVTVTQSGTQGCLPPWVPVTNLQYNMQVIGEIIIDGIVSSNAADYVGAFVGSECRGMSSPDPASGLVFLTIGSNTVSGDQIQFVVWRSDQCTECPTTSQLVFENQQLIGMPNDPYPFNCGFEELNLSFGQGYTWFAVNVNPGNMTVSNLFADLTPCQNNRIIGQSSFALYFNNTWMGSLTTISPSQMYKMELCSQQNLTLQGMGVSITPISLGAGFTWLGYQPQDCMGPNDALAGLTPAPSQNNRIIGQSDFAIYYGSSWMGSLTQMCPGKGYVAELSSNSILTYPTGSKNIEASKNVPLNNPVGFDLSTTLKQHNMNLVAGIFDAEGVRLAQDDMVLYAFHESECRGMVGLDSDSGGLMFLTIGSNYEAGEPISFKLWLPEQKQLLDIREVIYFESYKLLGTPDDPFLLSTFGLTSSNEINTNVAKIGEPYPNPFTQATVINYAVKEASQLTLNVFDGLGQKVISQNVSNTEQGNYQLIIQRNDLKAGIYHYRIVVANGKQEIHKAGKLIIF